MISTTRQPNKIKRQRLKQHKHGRHKTKKVYKDEELYENSVEDNSEVNSLCTPEYTSSGKSKLEVRSCSFSTKFSFFC